MLVMPEGGDVVRGQLLRGVIPDEWPAGWDYVRLALADSPAEAAEHVSGDDDTARYNRAVLVGGDGVWESFAPTDPDLAALAAVAAYSVGMRDAAPEVGSTTGEVAAVVLSARASAALERNDALAAVEELTEGAIAAQDAGSMILAASLMATRAELLRDSLGEAQAAADTVDAALRLIPRHLDDDVRFFAPPELWGELHVTRALARQELAATNPGLLLGVTQDLTEALKVFGEDTHPEQFAACNSHLALAYLVIPMSSQGDRLRVGVAVTSLRAALRV